MQNVRNIQTLHLVLSELAAADRKYPPMSEMLEGLHTIKCELAELEREIMRRGHDPKAMIKEAIQTSAMTLKFLRDCCYLPLPTLEAEEELRLDHFFKQRLD